MTVVENIHRLGGVEEGKALPRQIHPDSPGSYQLSLFNDLNDQ